MKHRRYQIVELIWQPILRDLPNSHWSTNGYGGNLLYFTDQERRDHML